MSEHKIRPDLEERAPDLIALQTHSNVVTVTGLESRQARSDWVHFCDLFKPQADYPDARNNGITDRWLAVQELFNSCTVWKDSAGCRENLPLPIIRLEIIVWSLPTNQWLYITEDMQICQVNKMADKHVFLTLTMFVDICLSRGMGIHIHGKRAPSKGNTFSY